MKPLKKAIIMMATYNGEKYIESQINSLLKQTYKNWSLYISDNGSTDRTLDILNKYKALDKRIAEIYVNKDKVGAYENYYFLMRMIKEKRIDDIEYFFYCDQDDIWDKKKIELEVELLDEFANVPCLCFSDASIIDSEGVPTGKKVSEMVNGYTSNKYSYLFEPRYMLGTTSAHNRKLWELIVLPSDNSFLIIPHDQLIRKFAAAYGTIRYISYPLVKYRRHKNNVSYEPHRYSLLKAVAKVLLSMGDSIKHCAEQQVKSLIFCELLDDIENRIILDYKKALFDGGIKIINFIRKYKIVISDDPYFRVGYELILFSKLYKYNRVYIDFINSRETESKNDNKYR